MYGSQGAKQGTDFRRSQLASHKKRARGTRIKRYRHIVETGKPASIVNKKRSLRVADDIIKKNRQEDFIALLITIALTALAIFGLFMGLTYIFQYI